MIRVPNQTLLTVIDALKTTAAKKDSRAYLNGILFSYNPEASRLDVAATDGHRVAQAKIKVQHHSCEHWKVLVPNGSVKLLQELVRIAAPMVELDKTMLGIELADPSTYPDTDLLFTRAESWLPNTEFNVCSKYMREGMAAMQKMSGRGSAPAAVSVCSRGGYITLNGSPQIPAESMLPELLCYRYLIAAMKV